MKDSPLNWNLIAEETKDEIVDFSVNINPLGIPDLVKDYLMHINGIGNRYPDSECKQLRDLLAQKYKIHPENILCGNGADDLLYRLIFAVKPKQAVIIEPVYEEYEQALKLFDCDVRHYMLKPEDQFELNKDFRLMIKKECDILFLCNPNNPTGKVVDRDVLMELLKICRQNNVLAVIDECFMEFLRDWKDYTLKDVAANMKHVIVIDAFTKTYALAGFRLGFCISGNQDLLSRIYRYGQAFSVSIPAQLAGICALMDSEYMEKTYRLIESEREWIINELKKYGVKTYSSKTNFLLIQTNEENVVQKLLDKGIKVRDCSKFYGLDSSYCRVAIWNHSENLVLLQAFKELFVK